MHPVTVKLKLLFQRICECDLGWDDKINEELTLKFLNVVKEFRNIKLVIIPRCYCLNYPSIPAVRTELHGISDASELCWAACIYFKFIKSNSDVQVSLVTPSMWHKVFLSHDKAKMNFYNIGFFANPIFS